MQVMRRCDLDSGPEGCWCPCHRDRFYDGEVRCPIRGDARGRTRDYVEGNSTDLDLAGCYGFLQVVLRFTLA